MAKDIEYGKCCLCGEKRRLTFEHVPPKAALNSNPKKLFTGEQIIEKSQIVNSMPWDFSDLKYTSQQKGGGGYYLCKQCNSLTGKWYAKDYSDFIISIHGSLLSSQKKDNVQPTGVVFKTNEPIYALRIFKQIIVMFCDINPGLSDDIHLKNFLLDRNNNTFNDNDYKLYAYLYRGDVERRCSFSYIFRKGTNDLLTDIKNPQNIDIVSEISCYPLGYLLYKNSKNTKHHIGFCLNELSKCEYDKKYNFELYLPYKDVNSWMISDFRTKDEIKKAINANKHL